MGLSFTTAIILAATPSSVCSNLMREFVQNEVNFTVVHEINTAMQDSSRIYAKGTSDYSQLEEWRRQGTADDDKYLSRGDRVLTLMIGQGCNLPDHTTSYQTYMVEVQACDAKRRDSGSPQPCDLVDNAMREIEAKAADAAQRKRLRRK